MDEELQSMTPGAAKGAGARYPGPELADWVEWKQTCDIARCGPEAAQRLAAYARHWFICHQRKLGVYERNPDEPPEGVEGVAGWRSGTGTCWQMVQHRLLAGQHRDGKRYKDWLFDYAARAPDPGAQSGAIRKGFALQVQMVVREFNPGHGRQAAEPHDPDTLLEMRDRADSLLPWEAVPALTEVEANEYREIAGRLAAGLLPGLSRRERVALVAKGLEIPLDHADVLASAGCGKSQLYAAWKALSVQVAQAVERDYGADDPEAKQFLAGVMLTELISGVLAGKESEKSFAALFSIGDESIHTAGEER